MSAEISHQLDQVITECLSQIFQPVYQQIKEARKLFNQEDASLSNDLEQIRDLILLIDQMFLHQDAA